MSSIHYIPIDRSGDPGLGQVISELKETLFNSNSRSDRENIAATVEQLLQAKRLSPQERNELIKLRDKLEKFPASTVSQGSFWSGLSKELLDLAGDKFAKALPGVFVATVFALISLWLFWEQSVDLYSAAQFEKPSLAAMGGILMLVGFAAFYGLKKSRFALLLCLYAIAYEGFFIVSGTLNHETVQKVQTVAGDPQIIWLQDNLSRSKSDYQRAKQRYDDPAGEVFQNGWFKKNFLDPAWVQYSAAQKQYSEGSMHLSDDAFGWDMLVFLKIFYRLGLVLLCMVAIHSLVRGKFA